MPRRWQPTPFLRLSAGLHALAAAGVMWRPDAWPWAAGAVVADHALITLAGLLPRTSLLGPNLTRLPLSAGDAVALTIDDGPDPRVTPRVLDLLDQLDTRASFFVIGERVLRHPALAREIVARGHALENHSHTHRHDFSLRGPRALAREVMACQNAIQDTCGVTPRFFRAPAGLRNPFLEPVLARNDLHLAAWTRRAYDTRNGDPQDVARRLTQTLTRGDILLLHDANAATTAQGDPVILAALPAIVQACCEAGLRPATLRDAVP